MTERKTYRLGDTVTVELDLEDESGVAEVVALFRNKENEHADITFRGDGEGQSKVTIRLEREVTEDTVPGEYYLQWAQYYDVHGHTDLKSDFGDFGFRVDNAPGDYQAPELKGWRLS